jgi:protein CrcB
MWIWLGRVVTAANRAVGGLAVDVGLYLLSAGFAWATIDSTLAAHRAWASLAVWGYAAGTAGAVAQLVLRGGARRGRLRAATVTVGAGPGRTPRTAVSAPGRAMLAVGVWGATVAVPLLLQTVQRADGRTGRAQEEVLVIEDGGRRLLDAGTPYLGRAAIAALPDRVRLLGYLPYQPGMTLFGLPRALDPAHAWWSDARVWFALVATAALAGALTLLRRAGAPDDALVRGLQVATVLPICALTLVTGGDDLPVLALCLLALALAATGRLGVAGLAIGAAAALKLFAWPVAVIVGVYAATRGRAAVTRYALGAIGLPLWTLIPSIIINPPAVVENIVTFPLGRGLVTSPAASPLPGYLLAHHLPYGRVVVLVLLALVAAGTVVLLVRRPPRTAAAACVACGLVLLAGMLLLPATRFGYLLYPTALLVWAGSLGGVRPRLADTGDSAGGSLHPGPMTIMARGTTRTAAARATTTSARATGRTVTGRTVTSRTTAGRTVAAAARTGARGRAQADVRILSVIALGGAAGAAARYGLGVTWPDRPGAGFPWTTFVVNISGCLVIGMLIAVLDLLTAAHPLTRPLLGTGFLGGYTTFSTYADQARALVSAGRWGTAVVYVVGTLVTALIAVRLGMLVVRVTAGRRRTA